MGGIINWMAYVWFATSETIEELFYMTVGDCFRRLISSVELRDQPPRIERRALANQNNTDTQFSFYRTQIVPIASEW
jgi:hypothetical protein